MPAHCTHIYVSSALSGAQVVGLDHRPLLETVPVSHYSHPKCAQTEAHAVSHRTPDPGPGSTRANSSQARSYFFLYARSSIILAKRAQGMRCSVGLWRSTSE